MSNIRVVIIEDHDLTRAGLEAALQRRARIEVVGGAGDGLRGLRLLETEKPDVAIVDIGLPDIDGIELVKRFQSGQAEDAPSSTKVLMLTMHKTQDSVLAAFAAGADSYCMKDIDMVRLEEAVIATHEGNPWIDPQIASIILQQVRQESETSKPQEANTIEIKGVSPEYEEIVEKAGLTEREIEILQLIVRGFSNAEVAEALYVTVGTIKTHVRHILNKLCVDDRTHAAVLALRAGIIE
ncbi:response regulator transcription factor [filamentous cyanobacterium LEGE 11480]|uniref:Response regulator transcription factor n=1 Tax=Romeriopsis navalis LEGE 11480 TaxID=2777977 RepID=A0A928VSS7_9CYAN|nr:response regulator transcription factor [Romeriopsis navalis]MBE9031434.1 response regulator transcription factor [Romeriopsis navalis LEGE 11480]